MSDVHKCFLQLNAILEEKNAALDIKATFNMSTGKPNGYTLRLPLVKINSNKRAPLPIVFCAFCPMCGERIKKKKKAAKEKT